MAFLDPDGNEFIVAVPDSAGVSGNFESAALIYGDDVLGSTGFADLMLMYGADKFVDGNGLTEQHVIAALGEPNARFDKFSTLPA